MAERAHPWLLLSGVALLIVGGVVGSPYRLALVDWRIGLAASVAGLLLIGYAWLTDG